MHEKTRHRNHSRNAPAGKNQPRNLPGRGHPIQHHPIPCSQPPGNLWQQALPELRQSYGTTRGPEGKAFLLRQVPHGMVEQPPGAGSEENQLHPRMRPLRKGV